MNFTDQALLEHFQQLLKKSIMDNRGELLAPDVLSASRELDEVVLKIMRQKGEC